jgi:hypothetical protein
MKSSLHLAILAAGLLLAARSHAADRPSVLLLFNDDQRAGTIAAHGNPHIQTPNLDTLELPAENQPPPAPDLTAKARVLDQWQLGWIVRKHFDGTATRTGTP